MIVVDASVTVKWLFTETYSPQALALVRGAVAAKDPPVAPPLLRAEVTNAVYQRIRRGLLTTEDALEVLRNFMEIPVRILSPLDLHRDALSLAAEYGLSAVYDAHYVSLGHTLGATVWTDDQRLLRELDGRLPFVRWIAEYGKDQG